MKFKGTPYYDMARDAGCADGDEAEQMAQHIFNEQRRQAYSGEIVERNWLEEIDYQTNFLTCRGCSFDKKRMSTALRLLVEVGKAGKGLKEAQDLVISAVTKQPTWVPTLVAHKKEWEKEFNKALAAAIADPDCAALIGENDE